MRRIRRTRMSTNRKQVLNKLVSLAKQDCMITDTVATNYNYAFGRLLNKFLDESRESVIDRYVDEEALSVTTHALNIVRKYYS